MTTDVDQPLPFTCPTCGAVSHQREDIEQRYCGRCHWWTGDPVLGKVHPSDPLARRLAHLLNRPRRQMLADDLEVLIPAPTTEGLCVTTTQDDWIPVDQHGRTGLLGDIIDLLVATERVHHEIGWDNWPCTLYMVTRSNDGEYQPAPARLGITGDREPREELAALAYAFEHVTGEALILARHMLAGYPVAHMIVFESWQRTEDLAGTTQKGLRQKYGTDRLADIPGSIECRSGLAIVGHHHMWLDRRRGKDPRLWVADASGPFAGDMFKSMCRIHAACQKIMRGVS